MNLDVVILAGGGGTRLWPLSRSNRPKQLLSIPAQQTLLEQTFRRVQQLTSEDRIWIITLASQKEAMIDVLPSFNPKRIISEPMGRNSGPAAATATFWVEAHYGCPVPLLLIPADHYVAEAERFKMGMEVGAKRAAEGESLVTYGIKVREPRADFGYIETKPESYGKIREVERFIEKPKLTVAKKFARSSRYFWNSGMFAWRSDFFGNELKRHAPSIFTPLSKLDWVNGSNEDLNKVYEELPNLSIDYALMEKSSKVEVVPTSFTWSDVGTWAAVYDVAPKDKNSNVLMGQGEVREGKRNLIHSERQKIVAFGVNDLVIVNSGDVTLVTTREKSKELKKLF